MRVRHYTREVLAGAVLAASAAGAPAAPIIFHPPATVASDTDVKTAGSLVYAYDESNGATTLNGVSFSAGSSLTALGGGHVTFSGFTGLNNSVFSGGTASPWSGLTAGYKTLLQGSAYTGFGGSATVTLNNLTGGHQYAVQFWVHDGRAANPDPAGRAEHIASADGNSQTLDYNSANALGGVGQHVTGLFLADGSTQSFTLAGTGTPQPSAQLNAIQLRDVSNIGCWLGTAGAVCDAATTRNFAANLYSAPLSAVTFASAQAPLGAVTFADAYWDGGAAVGVTQTNVALAAGGVSTGSVLFQNRQRHYTVTSSDTNGIGGATAVSIVGGGVVILAGAHRFTGATTVGDGVLRIAGTVQLSRTSGITLGGAGVLNVTAGVGTWNLPLAGAGTWNLAGAHTTWTRVTAAISGFTGTLNIGANAAPYGSSAANYPGPGAVINVANGGELNFGGGGGAFVTAAGVINLNGGTGATWDVTGAALRVLNKMTVSQSINLNAGSTIGCYPGQGGATFAGPIALDTHTLTVKVAAAADVLTMKGSLSGAGGAVVKTGAGTLVLAGNNSFGGAVAINAGTLQLAAPAPGALPANLRIMPLGDSITYGSGGSNAGYRGPLYSLLRPVASDVQFVGVKSENPGSLPTSPLDQTHHNGLSSYTLSCTSANLDGLDLTVYNTYGGASRNPDGGYWLDGGHDTGRGALHPDLVLLLLGANDVPNMTGVQDRLHALLTKLLTLRPGVRIIVADATPRTGTYSAATIAYNTIVDAEVALLRARGYPVGLCDLWTGFPSGGLGADGVHPNSTGYDWMATQWYNAILAAYSEASALPAHAAVSIAAGAALDVNGARATVSSIAGAGAIRLGAGVLTVDNAEADSFAGAISGPGSLIKTGPGPLTLAGSNTFTTDTLVSNGALVVSGVLASPVTVAAGATIGGAGTIRGNLTVQAGANIASRLPGNPLAILGNLTLGGTLNIEDAGGFGPGTFTLFTYTGGLTNLGVALGAVPADALVYTLDTDTPGQVGLQAALTPFGAWQTAHFGSYTNAEAASDADPDGDRLSNGEEFRAGTNPTNAASVLRLNALSVAGPGVVVAWGSVGGQRYRVQYSDGDARGGCNGVFGDIPVDLGDTHPAGQPGTLQLRDDFSLIGVPPAGNRYYRVRTIAP